MWAYKTDITMKNFSYSGLILVSTLFLLLKDKFSLLFFFFFHLGFLVRKPYLPHCFAFGQIITCWPVPGWTILEPGHSVVQPAVGRRGDVTPWELWTGGHRKQYFLTCL